MTQKTIWPDWPLILAYHSISDETSCPWDLCVSPAAFAEHLDVPEPRPSDPPALRDDIHAAVSGASQSSVDDGRFRDAEVPSVPADRSAAGGQQDGTRNELSFRQKIEAGG